MSIGKKILQTPFVQEVIAAIVSSYIKFVAVTSRFHYRRQHIPERLWKQQETFIIATWHGQNLLMPPFWHNWRVLKILVSKHGDGELLTRYLRNMGIGVIRGSGVPKGEEKLEKNKHKRGAVALREMVRELRGDASISMTADMPPGPAREAGLGIVALARLSGRPIVPVGLTTKWRITVNNWSKLKVNLPFSSGGLSWGEPIFVPGDADAETLERYRQQVEDALNLVNAEAEALAGLPVTAEGLGKAPHTDTPKDEVNG